MHSYGGYFGTEGLTGLGIKERAPKGLAGGIKWLAYMAAGLPRKGMGASDIEVPIFEDVGKGGPVDPMSMVFEFDLVLLPRDPVAMFYHDVPEDLRKQAVADLTGFAKWGLMAKVDNESWRNIDVAYLKCTDDRALPFPMQEKMIRDVQELGIEVRVSSCDSSHSPFLSQPQTVVDWIEGLTAV
ncbi:hypothetical protein BFW01_g284 [Lasiodiplodia theobromae]|nr:hypothetical protein BFW01_g284 [Lasiodiplodia theobromae]